MRRHVFVLYTFIYINYSEKNKQKTNIISSKLVHSRPPTISLDVVHNNINIVSAYICALFILVVVIRFISNNTCTRIDKFCRVSNFFSPLFRLLSQTAVNRTVYTWCKRNSSKKISDFGIGWRLKINDVARMLLRLIVWVVVTKAWTCEDSIRIGEF